MGGQEKGGKRRSKEGRGREERVWEERGVGGSIPESAGALVCSTQKTRPSLK